MGTLFPCYLLKVAERLIPLQVSLHVKSIIPTSQDTPVVEGVSPLHWHTLPNTNEAKVARRSPRFY